MNYLAWVKQIGWDKLAGVVVRVVAAVVEAIVKLVRRRKPVTPPADLEITILSISTETISAQWIAGPKTAPICASPSTAMLHPPVPAQAPVQDTSAEKESAAAWTSNGTPAGTTAAQVREQSK